MPYFDKVHYLLAIIMIVPQVLKLILPRYLGIILFHSVLFFWRFYEHLCHILTNDCSHYFDKCNDNIL